MIEVPVALAIISFFGLCVTAYLAYRGTKATATAQHAQAKASQTQAYAEETKATVEAMAIAVESLQHQATAFRMENAELRGKVSVLESQQAISSLYEAMLVSHINDGKGPPPPNRPITPRV